MKKIKPGTTHEIMHLVTEKDTAKAYQSGMVEVLATPALIALMEKCAQDSVAAYMTDDEVTVGTEVNMKHLKASWTGMEIRVKSTLTRVDGRKLHFKVEAWDTEGMAGKAVHVRYIVNHERFMKNTSD